MAWKQAFAVAHVAAAAHVSAAAAAAVAPAAAPAAVAAAAAVAVEQLRGTHHSATSKRADNAVLHNQLMNMLFHAGFLNLTSKHVNHHTQIYQPIPVAKSVLDPCLLHCTQEKLLLT